MNRNKELAKNTVILTVGKICTQFVSFMLLPLYTALLPPEDFGVVDLFNTYVVLLIPLFNWQFESGLFRFMVDYREDRRRQIALFSTVSITNFLQSFLFIVFYLIIQNSISSEYKIFLAIDVILGIFLNTLLQFARGIGKNTIYAMGSFLSASATVIFNVFLIAGLRMGAYGMFVATVVAKVITLLYLIFAEKVWQYFSLKAYDKHIFKEVSKYSFPLIPNQLSWWVIGASDRTIISYAINVAANGVYSVANRFSTVFITFYNIFNLSWTESAALHINDGDRTEFFTETINTMFRLFSAICIGIIACMPFVFPLFVNVNYAEAYQQIPILMLSVLFQVIVGLYSVIYVALKKSVEIAKTSFYAAVINIVVNILLIGFIGLYGASISTLAAYMTMAIYRYFHVKKYMNVKLNSKIIISTLVMCMITISAYYYKNLIINGIVLLVIIIYSVYINRVFLTSMLNLVITKVKQVKKKV